MAGRTPALAAITIIVIIVLAGAYYLAGRGGQPGAQQGGGAPVGNQTTTTTTTTQTTTTPQSTTTSLTAWKPDGVVERGEYEYNASFMDGDLIVYWRVENGTLYMALVGKTTGWVAIGFEPTTVMKDADMIFGWVYDSNGTVVVLDLNSTGTTGPHPPDTKLGGTNDILAYGGKQANGVTVIEFSRPLNTGDVYDRNLEGRGSVSVIVALGPSDSLTAKHYDTDRGVLQPLG
ncbi:MAG: DOMON domain-containing protein [Desulfurococcales archaeon]|nr:DOMON domain-containing protein [Desulfurococcales archaeon]